MVELSASLEGLDKAQARVDNSLGAHVLNTLALRSVYHGSAVSTVDSTRRLLRHLRSRHTFAFEIATRSIATNATRSRKRCQSRRTELVVSLSHYAIGVREVVEAVGRRDQSAMLELLLRWCSQRVWIGAGCFGIGCSYWRVHL
jgi:hypothetical protein